MKRRGVRTTALPTPNRQLPCNDPTEYQVTGGGQGSAPAPAPGNGAASGPGAGTPRREIRHNARITTYNFTTTTSNQQVAPDDPERAYLAIQNRGSNAIFVNFGERASDRSFRIAAGGFYEPYIAPTTSLNIIGVVDGDNVVIVEGTYAGR